MYRPPAFTMDDRNEIIRFIRESGPAQLVTMTEQGLYASPLPLFLVADEGEHGTLYGHLSRANRQWQMPPKDEALAIFMGPDTYVTPSWYATKKDTGKVVPTWNYVTIHAYGAVEFFDDAKRLLDVVQRLTDLHEGARKNPWKVSDAPTDYIASQLKGIVGLRMPLSRIEGKSKMSQNRNSADRAGVRSGLMAEGGMTAARIIPLIPE